MAHRKEPRIPDHLLDQQLAGAEAKSAFAKDELLDELKKALASAHSMPRWTIISFSTTSARLQRAVMLIPSKFSGGDCR
jgi:hypothetical protein